MNGEEYTMTKYRKKPVVIEAEQWTGTNSLEIFDFADWVVSVSDREKTIEIKTLEGTMIAREGDWIIKGIQGEFYPVKPDIFEETYELVE